MSSQILVVAITALVAACGGAGASSQQPDTPEAALEVYLTGVKTGNLALVESVYHSTRPESRFDLPQPIPVEAHRITKEIVFDSAAAKRYNERGEVLPADPAMAGDVELQVEQQISGKTLMFSYWLRRINGQWRIYALSVWGAP